MSITLKKGGFFNLTKKEPALQKIMVGLGWELKKGAATMDLDCSVFMLGANGKLLEDEYFIFYNNLKSPDGSLQHMGDNRSGKGDGDDELILGNLPLVNPNIQEALFVVSIHDAEIRKHHFGLLSEAYIRICDVNTEREILRYDLDAEFANKTDC